MNTDLTGELQLLPVRHITGSSRQAIGACILHLKKVGSCSCGVTCSCPCEKVTMSKKHQLSIFFIANSVWEPDTMRITGKVISRKIESTTMNMCAPKGVSRAWQQLTACEKAAAGRSKQVLTHISVGQV